MSADTYLALPIMMVILAKASLHAPTLTGIKIKILVTHKQASI